MRFTVRSLALTSAGALALVGLTVPAASAATGVTSAPTYGAASTTEIVTGTTLHSGDTISLSLTSGSTSSPTRTLVADASGTWTYTFSAADVQALPDGTVTVNVSEAYCQFLGGWTGSDTSSCPVLSGPATSTASKTFAKDTHVPAAPTITGIGTNYAINNVNVAGVTATGQAEANSTLTLKLGTVTATATANSSGLWSMFFSASGLADGTYTASVTQAEAGAAHNVGPAATHSVVKDTAAAVKTATSPATGATVAAPAKVSFTYTKALASNSTIVLKNGGGTAVGCTVAVSGSTVSCTPSPALASGAYSATATAYDAHGNQTVTAISFTVDATAPSVTSLKATNTTGTTPKSTVTGHVSEAATLTVTSSDSTGAKVSASVKTTAAANFSVAVDENTLGGGTITVTVKAVDAYGNTSTTTTTHTRTIPVGTSVSISVPGWTAVGWSLTIHGSVHLAKAGAYGTVAIVHTSGSGAQQIITPTPIRVAANGTYTFTYTPGTSGTYHAVYFAASGNGATSPESPLSQLRYAISASTTTGPATAKAVISGAVHNPPAGTYVLIYKRNADGTWTQIGKAYIDRSYHYQFAVTLPKGSTAIRVSIPASHGFFGNAANVTATRT